MEVVVPVPAAMDFNFDSTCSSPYMTAPSSPQRFGNFFFSAPTSPTRASSASFYRELNDLSRATSSSSSFAVPFEWEEKPGTPKRKAFDGRSVNRDDDRMSYNDGDRDGDGDECEDFEFNFSGQLERSSLSAEELFDGGKIRPLKPPPGYDHQFSSTVSSPRSPKSRAFRKKDVDPFEAALEKSRKRVVLLKEPPQQQQDPKNIQRGRQQRTSGSFSSSSSSSYNYVHKKSRSLSPFRVSDIMFEQEETPSQQSQKTNMASTTSNNPKSYVSSILSAMSFSRSGNRKWKLKDLLLFRSASEGRATSKDPLQKYAILSKKEPEDVKNSSFRSTESVGSVSGSRRRAPVSAHELHYTANRAVSEEMRRKTFLPYKHGLLGCLGFNRGMHEITRSIGSLTRG
ncbi:hypothetical protein PTKIN_Ptkin02bG0183800 [Pterospermum kingtungense]